MAQDEDGKRRLREGRRSLVRRSAAKRRGSPLRGRPRGHQVERASVGQPTTQAYIQYTTQHGHVKNYFLRRYIFSVSHALVSRYNSVFRVATRIPSLRSCRAFLRAPVARRCDGDAPGRRAQRGSSIPLLTCLSSSATMRALPLVGSAPMLTRDQAAETLRGSEKRACPGANSPSRTTGGAWHPRCPPSRRAIRACTALLAFSAAALGLAGCGSVNPNVTAEALRRPSRRTAPRCDAASWTLRRPLFSSPGRGNAAKQAAGASKTRHPDGGPSGRVTVDISATGNYHQAVRSSGSGT